MNLDLPLWCVKLRLRRAGRESLFWWHHWVRANDQAGAILAASARALDNNWEIIGAKVIDGGERR